MAPVRPKSTVSKVILWFLPLMALLAACGDPTAPTPTPAPTQATPTPAAPGVEPSPTPVEAFDAEAYFQGKTIRIIVGFGAGGGTDTEARFFAARLGDFIPGRPRITISNLTPQLAASNFVWNAPPDGLTLQYTAGTLMDLAQEPTAEFQVPEFGIIGAPAIGYPVWWIRGNLPYQDISDAIGATGPPIVEGISAEAPAQITSFDLAKMMVEDWLDIPMEYRIVADTGTASVLLMLERGDSNSHSIALGGTWFSLPNRNPGWFGDGFLRPFADFMPPGQEIPPNAEIPWEAPSVHEFLNEEQWRTVNALVQEQAAVNKQLHTSPGTPPEVLQALRDAWDEALADPSFAEDFNRITGGRPLTNIRGEELQPMYEQLWEDILAVQDQVPQWQQQMFQRWLAR